MRLPKAHSKIYGGVSPSLTVGIHVTGDADIHVGGREFVENSGQKQIKRMLASGECCVG
jgi:hypothetical protein